MITLFTCPKPFTDPHIRMIQRNAIESWRHLQPQPEIVLFGDDAGVAETAEELEVRHIARIAKNNQGTPLVSDLFAQAQRQAAHDILAYVNADIILEPSILSAARHCAPLRRFLLVGRRWDLDVTERVDFTQPQWFEALRAQCLQQGSPHDVTGLDYFIFPKGMWRAIPPFALGRGTWDNWLLFGAVQCGAKLIDGSKEIFAIHQNHGYEHIACIDMPAVLRTEEAVRNRSLADSNVWDLVDCRYRLSRSGVLSVNGKEYVERRMERLHQYHPWLWRVLMFWRVRGLYCRYLA